jgi:hypothetical protein
MDDDLFADRRLYEHLLLIDRELCEKARRERCPQCAGRLDSSAYPRKPRGLPPDLDEAHTRRLSLCCDVCRQRVTPPSVRFLGRRVYTGVVLLLASARRLTAARLRELQALLGVDRRTLYRWRRWWQESLVRSSWWRLARGQFLPPLDESCLPAALLERFEGADPARRLVQVLAFLAPLSVPGGQVG